ncbi:hypothetical protein Tco_1198277, partial [Tanacetum coccineum]
RELVVVDKAEMVFIAEKGSLKLALYIGERRASDLRSKARCRLTSLVGMRSEMIAELQGGGFGSNGNLLRYFKTRPSLRRSTCRTVKMNRGSSGVSEGREDDLEVHAWKGKGDCFFVVTEGSDEGDMLMWIEHEGKDDGWMLFSGLISEAQVPSGKRQNVVVVP